MLLRENINARRLRRATLVATAALLVTTWQNCPLHLSVEAYITSGLPAHAHRAMLQKLTEDICQSEPGSLSHEELSNAPKILSAWATAPQKLKLSSRRNGKKRALATEGLLKRVIDERRAGNINAIARTEDYNAVMRSWALSGEKSAAALRVEEILNTMQNMYSSGQEDIQPNVESFQIAIEAWTRATDDENSPLRAHQILKWMCDIYASGANDLVEPRVSCFQTILHCWANSGKIEAPIMTEHIILWMKGLHIEGNELTKPTTMCFNAVLLSWLKSGDVNAEKRIRDIFEYMELARGIGNTDIKPDMFTYSMVVSSIAPAIKNGGDSTGAERADRILGRLAQGFLAGDQSLRPDCVIYNQVIDYWAKAQSIQGHYMRALEVLQSQKEMFSLGVNKCRPDTMGYTSVIAACASTYGSKKERTRAFDSAHSTFVESCNLEYAKPNDVTYGLMFKATNRLLHKKSERDRYGRSLFEMCCRDGCLGEMAYTRMKEAITPELFFDLTDNAPYNKLPLEWKHRLRKAKRVYSSNRKSGRTVKLRP